jgi:putative FmdB family regulatory protein
MPIYAYRCASCGFEKDVLQKLSDSPLTQCPECGKDTLRKQLTAAGFQLKGSGWYVTDFRGGNTGAAKANSPGDADKAGGDSAGVAASKSDGTGATKSDGAGATKSDGAGASTGSGASGADAAGKPAVAGSGRTTPSSGPTAA